MSCEDASTFIEAVALGDPIPDAVRAHLTSCATCAARVALAQQIDAVLARRPVPALSQGFTTAVMSRVRHERWRTERFVDLGFNVAVAAGIVLIVAGGAGLAWRSGAMQLGSMMAALVVDVTRATAARAAADAQLVTTATLLVTTAFGLWWWAGDDVSV